MNCLTCGFRNPETVSYCQKCGKKLDYTADDIREALVEKAKQETAKSTEFYARQSLIFAIVLFLIAMTAFVVSKGAPTDTYFIPSAANGANYVKVDYTFQAPNPPLKIAVPEK